MIIDLSLIHGFDEIAKASQAISKSVLSPAFTNALSASNLHIEDQIKVFQSPFNDILQGVIQSPFNDILQGVIQSPFNDMLQGVIQSPFNDMLQGVIQSPFNDMLQGTIAAQVWAINTVQLNETLFTLPTLIFPTFDIANCFSEILPDLSWVTSLTDQLNIMLKVIPDWPLINLRDFKEKLKLRIIAAFKAVGLCFAPSMSEDLMYQVLDFIELSGKRSTAMLVIWNYYAQHGHKRLQQAVEKWQDNPEFARRWRNYLHPAFEAHTEGKYGLSINALTPMIEGIASHIVKENNLKPATKPKRGTLGLGSTEAVILRALKKAGDENNLEQDTTELSHWVRVKSALEFGSDLTRTLEFEKDYEFIHLGSRQLSRHGSLHGIQLNTATAFNSLRLFLLLDTMFYLLQTYTASGGLV